MNVEASDDKLNSFIGVKPHGAMGRKNKYQREAHIRGVIDIKLRTVQASDYNGRFQDNKRSYQYLRRPKVKRRTCGCGEPTAKKIFEVNMLDVSNSCINASGGLDSACTTSSDASRRTR